MYIQYFNYTNHNYVLIQDNITYVHYVYRITNLINDKFYIGKHSHCLSNKYDDYMGGGNLIVKAIKKYGKESFKKEITSYYKTSSCALIGEGIILTKDIAKQNNCYNLKAGGEGGSAAGRKLKDETIIKRTKSQKGLKRSEETRKRLGLAKKGSTISEKTRKKISDSLKGENNPLYGTSRSEEVRKKIGDAQRGEKSKFYGKTHTEEMKRKISDGVNEYWKNNEHPNKGKSRDPELVKKSADTMRGRVFDIKNKNVTIVEIDGMVSTLKEASNRLLISTRIIYARCESYKEEYDNWKFIRIGSGKRSIDKKEKPNHKNTAKKVSIDGIIYDSIGQAHKVIKTSVSCIAKRCRSDLDEWTDWYFIEL